MRYYCALTFIAVTKVVKYLPSNKANSSFSSFIPLFGKVNMYSYVIEMNGCFICICLLNICMSLSINVTHKCQNGWLMLFVSKRIIWWAELLQTNILFFVSSFFNIGSQIKLKIKLIQIRQIVQIGQIVYGDRL